MRASASGDPRLHVARDLRQHAPVRDPEPEIDASRVALDVERDLAQRLRRTRAPATDSAACCTICVSAAR